MDFPDNDDGFEDWQDPDAGSLDSSVLLDDPHHPQSHFHHHPPQVEPQRLAASAVNTLLTPFHCPALALTCCGGCPAARLVKLSAASKAQDLAFTSLSNQLPMMLLLIAPVASDFENTLQPKHSHFFSTGLWPSSLASAAVGSFEF